jgi:hypothetical protein
VEALVKKLRDNAANPKNFSSYVSVGNESFMTLKFLAEIKDHVLIKNSGKGDLIDLQL